MDVPKVKEVDKWFKNLDSDLKKQIYELINPLLEYATCDHDWTGNDDKGIFCKDCGLRDDHL